MGAGRAHIGAGLRVLGGFVVLFLAVWVVNLVLGIGPNWVMRWLGVTPNVRTFVGSTLSYGVRLAAMVLLSALAVQKVLRLNPRNAMFATPPGWWKSLILGCLLATGAMLLLFVIEVGAGWLIVEGWSWQGLSTDAWLRNLWLAVLINSGVAVGEEAVFRGYLLTGLERAWGQRIGLCVMAIIFAAPHLLVTGAEETRWLQFVVMLTLPGLMLGWAYLRVRALWLPIGIHFAWNFMQNDLLNLNGQGVPSLVGVVSRQQGPEWFVGTRYGIEVGLAGLLATALVWLGIWLWTRPGGQQGLSPSTDGHDNTGVTRCEMKRYGLPMLALLFLSALVACKGTLEVGVAGTPTPRPESALGELAYIQGGDIWVRDLRDFPNGEPRRLTTDGENLEPRWSPSGRWLAFRKGDSQVWVMDAEGSAAHPLDEGAAVGAFAWAPLADRLAYVAGDSELRTVNPEGDDPLVLVLQSPSSTIGQIVWSPDGEWVAYEWQEQEAGHPPTYQGLFKASADGKERIPVYPDYPSEPAERGGFRLVGWSGGGCSLLFQDDMGSSSLLADGAPLYAVPADGGTPVRLADAVLAYPDFVASRANDATQIAAITGSYRATWTTKSLYLLSTSAEEDKALTSPDVAASSPAWSPDGQKIAYVALPDRGDSGGGEPASPGLMERRIFVVNSEGAPKPLQLTGDLAYRDERPLWAANGSHILFARLNAEDQASLWLVPAEGGDPLQVVKELMLIPEQLSYYGHIDWDKIFDWWTGLYQTVDCSALAPTMAATQEGGLSISGKGGVAQQVVIEFLQAVEDGNVGKALTYWNLKQADQPANYGEFIREMVSEWATGEHRFVVGETTYAGFVGPQDYRPLDEDDPRVQGATVEVRIDDGEGAFGLEKVDNRWFIHGWMVPDGFTSEEVDSGLLFLREGNVYVLDERGKAVIGPLPEDAGYLAVGTGYLAYHSDVRIRALGLADGATRTLLVFPGWARQDFHLCWSTDGSALAYAVASDKPDGSRIVELGTTDGYQQTVVDTPVARPAGATPTPPPMPPMPPQPGFASLHILGFDRAAGRLVVMPVGGQEDKSKVWTYDLRQGQRVQEQWWPTAVVPPLIPVLSPDLTLLAAAQPSVLQIYRADNIGADWTYVELPAETHATWLSWSPDSQYLAYLLHEGASPGLDVSPSLGLWVWEAQSGEARQLSPTISPEAALHGWTADGRAVVLETLDGIGGQVTASLVDVATGQGTPLPLPQGSRVLGWIGDSPSEPFKLWPVSIR